MDQRCFLNSFALLENYESKRHDFTYVLVDLDGSIKCVTADHYNG